MPITIKEIDSFLGSDDLIQKYKDLLTELANGQYSVNQFARDVKEYNESHNE